MSPGRRDRWSQWTTMGGAAPAAAGTEASVAPRRHRAGACLLMLVAASVLAAPTGARASGLDPAGQRATPEPVAAPPAGDIAGDVATAGPGERIGSPGTGPSMGTESTGRAEPVPTAEPPAPVEPAATDVPMPMERPAVTDATATATSRVEPLPGPTDTVPLEPPPAPVAPPPALGPRSSAPPASRQVGPGTVEPDRLPAPRQLRVPGNGFPASLRAMMDSVDRSGPSNTAVLVGAAELLVANGVNRSDAIGAAFGRFPVAGSASYSHDWWFPRFGPGWRLHQGTDIFAAHGTPVLATVDGVVSIANGGLGGLSVRVTEADGTFWYLAHLSAVREGLVAGAKVRAGDVIGYVGNSGNARTTPPHVHLEIHPGGGSAVDPKPTLDRLIAEAEAALPAVLEGLVPGKTTTAGPEAALAAVAPPLLFPATPLAMATSSRPTDPGVDPTGTFGPCFEPTARRHRSRSGDHDAGRPPFRLGVWRCSTEAG